VFTVGVTFPACPATDGPDYLVSISGLRLTNGRVPSGDSSGGAIYTEHSLLLNSMVIDTSLANKGGGVAFWAQYPGQTLTVRNSQFLGNAATPLLPPTDPNNGNTAGGGMTFQDKCTGTGNPFVTPVTVTIANSEFRGNVVAPVTLGGKGGGLRSFSLADVTISDSIFVDNHIDAPNPPFAGRSYHGGAIDGTAKSWRIERSEIAENSVFDVTGADVTRSGGLHMYHDAVDRQGAADVMPVKIIDSTISANQSSATAGAMVAYGNVALNLSNSTVTGNIAAPTRTGGLIMSSGITNPDSGYNTAQPSLTLVSSIVANSNPATDISSSRATMPTFAFVANQSLIRTLCGICVISVSGAGNLFGVDPLLGPLVNNGGPSRTHALLPGSPAINAGSNPLGLANDQRGAGFPRVSSGVADMGAYESP